MFGLTKIEISYEFHIGNHEIIRDCIADLVSNGWTLECQETLKDSPKIKLTFSTKNEDLIERIKLNPIK